MTKKWPYPLPRGDARHGTGNGYSNFDCRCPKCKAAHRKDQQEQRDARIKRTIANGGIAPPPAKHGRPSTYGNWRCKCEPCVRAHNDAAARRRRGAPARSRPRAKAA